LACDYPQACLITDAINGSLARCDEDQIRLRVPGQQLGKFLPSTTSLLAGPSKVVEERNTVIGTQSFS
jgi:hypothetical protein